MIAFNFFSSKRNYPTSNYHISARRTKMVWFVKDICGMVCATMTWFLIAFSQYVVVFVILLPGNNTIYKTINLIIFEIFTFMAMASHLRTMFTNPGAVPRGTATRHAIQEMGMAEGQVLYKCQKCCSVKPERAHHCSVCQRCIRKMDHHCPWVNNCVGENNQKFFVLFTMYIAVISIHALILSLTHFYVCFDSDFSECTGTPRSGHLSAYNLIFLIFLVFEAKLFAIFTIIMFIFQLKAIWSDETGIEHLKKESNRPKRGSMHSFMVVFGKDFRTWFSPFSRTTGGFINTHNYSCQV